MANGSQRAAVLPDKVLANAWRGRPVSGSFGPDAGRWALGPVVQQVRLAAPAVGDPDDWTRDAVGWGIVVPDTNEGTVADRAEGRDLPEIVQNLIAARDATVLRYRPGDPRSATHLFRYHPARADAFPLPVAGGKRGKAVDAVPVFLMILAQPDEIPWEFQFDLNLDPRTFAGRVPLNGEPLANYITALLDGWNDDPAAPSTGRALVWSTEHDETDITRLMRLILGDPVRSLYEDDADVTVRGLAGTTATVAGLTEALAADRPGVVVTTSHGFTGPEGAPDVTRLGVPVATDHELVDVAALCEQWAPAGAVWYAHACCGAGCDAPSSFDGLFERNGELDTMMLELAGVGPVVAPLPLALLGAKQPARAFVGHVEPTFDWTLQDEDTNRSVVEDLVDGLYSGLLLGRSVGRAMAPFQIGAGPLAAALVNTSRPGVLNGSIGADVALRQRIRYLDRRSLVVLGDPAAALPSLAPLS